MSTSIIHLSDIHIKSEQDSFFEKKESMINVCVNSVSNKDNIIIVVSGDISFSGEKQQYILAERFLNEIQEKLYKKGNRNIEVICVPGNHDCNFTNESQVRKILVNNIINEEINCEVFDKVSEVQKDYHEFVDRYKSKKKLIQFREISFGAEKYGFLLINTAWMSKNPEEYGGIIIPKDFYEKIELSKYEKVFSVFHHPFNWLNDCCRNDFIKYIESNSDIILVGHEHNKMEFCHTSSESSVACYKAKELQNSENKNESGFSILTMDIGSKKILFKELLWNGNTYVLNERTEEFEKNKIVASTSFTPNKNTMDWINDVGFTVNHFAKENVSLGDIFVWPDINRCVHYSDRQSIKKIREGAAEELLRNSISIIHGPSLVGKTTIVKELYMRWKEADKICIYVAGSDFKNSSRENVLKVLYKSFGEQYSLNMLDEYRNLAKNRKSVIVDDFDAIAMIGNRRSDILDVLTDVFENVVIIASSEFEVTSFMMTDAVSKLDKIISYEVLPFGNSKRRELVKKWYSLANLENTNEEIEKRVDKGIEALNVFLGNGAGFVPAYPIYLISALQNIDASQTNNTSKYGYLYETMIQKSLSRISGEYSESGAYNIDIELVSTIAFFMLNNKKSFISYSEIEEITEKFNIKKKLRVISESLMRRMEMANVWVPDTGEGVDVYRFKYPYIFYFFAGRYMAYNLDDKIIMNTIEKMSSKLYIETYGNIMIFVCHFANNTDVIDTILINAYETLGNYPVFDFFEKNPNDGQIEEVLSLFDKKMVGNNNDVQMNKEKRLAHLDDMKINDGTVSCTDDNMGDVDIEASDIEKDLASISAALKTMDVLGQIIQNYPGGIDGELKTEIIGEIYRLGMRSMEAISQNMDNLKGELIGFVYERAEHEKKPISMKKSEELAQKLINILTYGMIEGMIHKISISINSKYLDSAAKEALIKEESCFAMLVLVDLQLNCFNVPSLDTIERVKDKIESERTLSSKIASGVLRDIVVRYLKYNTCEFKLRQRLCGLFGIILKGTKPSLETKPYR